MYAATNRMSPGFKLSLFVVAIIGLCSNARSQSSQEPSSGRTIEIKNPVVKAMQTLAIASGVAGIVAEVPVHEGDIVKPESILARIRDEEARVGLDRSKQALAIATLKADRDIDIRLAEKSLQVAEQELARAVHANQIAADTYPPNEIDRYTLLADRARIEVERAKLDKQLASLAREQCELDVRQSQLLVSRHTIKSPSQAIVVSVEKQAGEWVEASTKIVELILTDRLRIEGFVDADQATMIGANTSVHIAPAGVGKSIHTGKVVFVSPTVNPVNQQVRVFVDVANDQQSLRPGVALSARIIVNAVTSDKP